MRLLSKTILYFLLAMVPLLAIAGFYLFRQFSLELDRRSDNELINEEIQWVRYIQSQSEFGTAFLLRTPDLVIAPVEAEPTELPDIRDSYSYNPQLRTNTPYRVLAHVVSINGVAYQINIRKSQEQKLVLVRNLTRMMLLVFLGLFIATMIFNWFISRRLWRPFQESLAKIKTAELQKMEGVRFGQTNIDEFNELNTSLNFMTSKMYRDYQNIKEFTENAAHEMQTPIAVVQSKLELLLQDSTLRDEQADSIVQALDALSRLGKLNQGLLLLAKIENNQFASREELNLAAIAERHLNQFAELIDDKQLQLKRDLSHPFTVNMNPFLADSLLANLVGNAIKYNTEHGLLDIYTSDQKLVIKNTGSPEALNKDRLFTRFAAMDSTREDSNGLGLAIVKKIAESTGLLVDYQFENGQHTFILSKSA